MPTNNNSLNNHRQNNNVILDDDDAALNEAARLQQSTLAVLRRIQSTNAETQESGIQSLEALKEQREQFGRVFAAADRVDTGLQKTEKLQNKLGLLSLRFGTKRSAKKDVDSHRNEARKLAQQHAKLAEKRLKEKRQDTGDDDASSNASSKKSNADEKANKAMAKKQKKKNTKKALASFADGFALKKDLLYGVDLTNVTNDLHREKLQQLNETDQEIDTALDEVSTQVETILSMGKEMRREVIAQDDSIDVLTDRVERSQYKQEIVNKRTTKFLDGRVRKQHAIVDTFGTKKLIGSSPLASVATATAARKAVLEI
jgi:hypothetical protein